MTSLFHDRYNNNILAGESNDSAALSFWSDLPSPGRLDINMMPGVEPVGLSWANESNYQPREDCFLSRSQRYIERSYK